MPITHPGRTTRGKRRYLAVAVAALAVLTGGRSSTVVGQGQAPPILLVVNSAAPNPFGPYLAEILRAEGIQSFATVQLSALDASTLASAKLAILAETPLTAPQATLFTDYVNGGGRLVAMKPDAQLAAVLGISVLAPTTPNGYLLVDQAGPGAGLQAMTLPFKGVAANYALAGATEVASLYSTSTTDSGLPAVVTFGRTATWSFDLARSTAYTRQGDPAFAGQERDGIPILRTTDIFYGNIDTARMSVPHADVQMRLFSRVIGTLLADEMPLPRLWYFPGVSRTMLLPTADSHTSTVSPFSSLIASAEAKGARISLYFARYLTIPPAASTWRANGHEVGLHPYMSGDGVDFPTAYQTAQNWFSTQGLGAPGPTVRHHSLEWAGWTSPLATMAANGIRMDTSYYSWGPTVYNPTQTSQAHGYITGSGLPMRFVDNSGSVFPVYQQVTSLVDEQMLVGDYGEGLTPTAALAVSQQLIDQSQAGGYSAIMTQFHIDYYQYGEVQPWVDGTMSYAQSQGVPMWSTERWLRFTEGRAATAITNLDWSDLDKTLTFSVTVPTASEAQSVLVPANFGGSAVTTVIIDGVPTASTPFVVNGQAMRAFNVTAAGGAARSVAVLYGVAIPSVSLSDVSVSEGQSGSTVAGVTVSLSSPTANPVSVQYQTADGTATAGPDYQAAAGILTFAPLQTSQVVPLSVLGDLDLEPAETFSLTLTAPTNATIADTVGIVTILDDDAPPTIDVSDASVTEGNSGTTNADFVVSLAGARGYPIAVQYAIADGSATAGSDYTAGSGTVTFAPGVTSQTVPVPVIGDTATEPDETFTLTLSAPVNGVIGDAQAIGTIVNDDSGAATITATYPIAAGGDDVNEDGAAFTPDGATVWVGSGAAATASYAGLRFANVTIPAGATIASARLDFQAASTQWLNIAFEFAMEASTNSAPFSAASMPSQRALLAPRVNHASDAQWIGGTRYQLDELATILQTAINQPGWTSGNAISFVLRSTGQAWARKFANAFETSPASAPRLVVTYTTQQSPLPSLSISDVSVAEGNSGPTNAVFTVTLSSPSAQAVTVDYATTSGTAQSGSDFTNTSGTLTFPAGTTSLTVTVPVVGDTTVEPTETFTVGLSNPANATIADGTGQGTVSNDDVVPALSINDAGVTEGNTGSTNAVFTVTLSSPSAQAVTVDYATASGTAQSGSDFTNTSGTLTFPAGTTSLTVTVPVVGDTTVEPTETFTVGLSNPANATIADGTGQGTVTNDDVLPALSINAASVTEGNTGSVNATFTVTLSAASAQPVSVTYGTVSGTATAGADFTTTSATLTIPAGAISGAIVVPVLGDLLDEAVETFTVVLSAPVNASIATGTGTGTIADNDPTPSLAVADLATTEGAGATAVFTVTLSAASGNTVTVNYTTTANSAAAGSDYVATSGTLTFAPGIRTRTVTVDLVDNVLNEAAERFYLDLSTATNATIADTRGIATISDNDPLPAVTIADASITEGNSGRKNLVFTLTLSAPSARSVTVSYATANGTAVSSSDYVAKSGTATFAAGVTSITVFVRINGDTTVEPNETFFVNLSSAVNGTIADAQAVGTILNDE
jgi:Calx-beta domain